MGATAAVVSPSVAPLVAAEPAIRIEGLAKHYKAVRAVDGITLSVSTGEIFSLLGHNGAGKSTTIKMLTGRVRPTAGSATVLGKDIVSQRDDFKPLINLVSQEQNLYERMTGRDNLRFFAQLYGVSAGAADGLLDVVALSDAAGRRVKTYSNGMKQRLLIARALVNKPHILFLDEPTAGLDPLSARQVRNLLKSLREQGTTIFLTTHYMEEADELSDRVAFIAEGKIVALDTPRELKLRFGKRTAKVLLRSREEVRIDLEGSADAARVSDWMTHGDVMTIHSQEGTLEDVFIALAGRAL